MPDKSDEAGTAELWERSSVNQRYAWMRAAGHTADVAAFASWVPWQHLPTSAQWALRGTSRPAGIEGD